MQLNAANPALSLRLDPHETAWEESLLERSPKWLICVPLTLQWLWLGLRYRSLTIPSCANPRITSGGLVGEGKLEYFRDMGPVAIEATARHCGVLGGTSVSEAQLAREMDRASLTFPLIAKPDLGLCGHGVQRIDSMAQLHAYLRVYPAGETVVLQEYLAAEGEAGIFYARHPGALRGQVISLALRYYPRVTGDGRSTVAALVDASARARRAAGSRKHVPVYDPHRVPAAGEVVRLSTIGSTRVGGLYRDARALITPQLTAAIDAIAQDMPDFHFGRFDVRFESLNALADGEGFRIMEINGAGSEAIEAWDPETSLLDSLRMIFRKQRLLFAIGSAMRRRGHRPIGLPALARLNRRQLRLIAAYPPSN